MDRRLQRSYAWDCTIIVLSMVAAWIVLAFILREALPLAPGTGLRVALVAAALLVGLFSTAALVAVLIHLRKNGESLYAEDVAHLQGR